MSQAARLYIVLKVLLGFFGTINVGISTAFLLQKPVSFFELSLIYSLILGVSLLLEYPTGNLADRYGRKLSFALGMLAIAVQYAFYAAFSNVFLLYFAGVVGGVGDALVSGSLEAWLGEEEKRRAPEPSLHRVFGVSRSLTSLFSIVGSLGIGLLLRADLAFVYWTGAIMLAVAGLGALTILPDNRGREKTTLRFSVAAIRTFVSSPLLLFLTFILAASYACYSVFILYWQPQAQILGITLNRLPLLYSAYLAATALSSYLYARLARQVGGGYFVYASFAFIALSFAFMFFGNDLVSLVMGLFSFGLGFGSVYPLFFDWTTDVIPSDLRASLLSLMSTWASATAVFTTAAIGKAIEIWGLEVAVRLGLGFAIGILLLLGLVKGLSTREAYHVQIETRTEAGE